MTDDPSRSPSFGLEPHAPEHEALTSQVLASVQPQVSPDTSGAISGASSANPRTIWPGMTAEQTKAYIEGTKKRGSRKKQRPSLEKYADVLRDCVRGKAVMRQVFDDLVEVDPAVLEEFGPDGHRAFNACVKRMF